MIVEGRYLVSVTTSPAKNDLKLVCDEAEELINRLADLAKIGEVRVTS